MYAYLILIGTRGGEVLMSIMSDTTEHALSAALLHRGALWASVA